MRIIKLNSYPGHDFAIINGTPCKRAWDKMRNRPSKDTWEFCAFPLDLEVLAAAREERRRGSWWSKAGR